MLYVRTVLRHSGRQRESDFGGPGRAVGGVRRKRACKDEDAGGGWW
jgi:hypothetical protein